MEAQLLSLKFPKEWFSIVQTAEEILRGTTSRKEFEQQGASCIGDLSELLERLGGPDTLGLLRVAPASGHLVETFGKEDTLKVG